jgi:hypothetical protein
MLSARTEPRKGRAKQRLALAFAGTIATTLFAAGTAFAAAPVNTAESRETCAAPQIEQPFAAFRDFRDYVLAPGGSFEDPSLPGWRLDAGAEVGVGNDPFNVRGGEDAMSLALPAGASATSPAMCVDLHWPTMRFVGFQEDEHDAELDIEVLYPEVVNEKDRYKWHKVESLKSKQRNGWQPTKDIKLEPQRGGKLAGGRPVALRFTNDSDIGTWRIDNLYVDPRMRR